MKALVLIIGLLPLTGLSSKTADVELFWGWRKLTRKEVVSPILIVAPSERWKGVFGGIVVSSKTVPFEECRSRSVHWLDSIEIERCLVEMPGSLMGRVLPRMTRPILIVDPGGN